jgi:hypothetical protein
MSDYLDDDLYRDDPAEPWAKPTEPRKTLRETNPLPFAPHYPASLMVLTSFGFHVPRHLRERCENAYHDARDRMRMRGGIENEPPEALEAILPASEYKTTAPVYSVENKQAGSSAIASPRPRPRLLGWEPPPPDHVEAYLASGGS